VQLAREEGESIVQAFHPTMAQRGGHLNRILNNICAMANSNGGTIYIGVTANPKENPSGVREPGKSIDRLHTVIANRFSPEPDVQIDSLPSKGKQVVRITVQPGRDLPYAIDDNKFYVRDESETSLAVRDEIVRLVEKGQQNELPQPVIVPTPPPGIESPDKPARSRVKEIQPPRTGVEIVKSEKRKGIIYHTVRDLRNGNLIKNVTRSSARKLWHYAITQVEAGVPEKIEWEGNIALLKQRHRNDNVWYDLALRDGDEIHYYYGVTDSGLNEDWLPLIGHN
jgi:hypothetical protein